MVATAAPVARAEYMPAELELVPVERLVANLERQMREQPDARWLPQRLARVHAAAYASKEAALQIQKGHEDEGPWFGYEPPYLPFRAKDPGDDEARRIAAEHLDEAIRFYEKAVAAAPDDLVAQLGLAWCLDRRAGGDGEDRRRAIEGFRQVASRAWKKERRGYGSVSYLTVEAGTYLAAHLDPVADRDELEEIEERAETLREKGRPFTPIAIPLDPALGPGDLVDPDVVVDFDLDGSALPQRWPWLAPGAAWLAWDPRGDGRIRSGLQLFGSASFWIFWRDGYEALAGLDDDGDGWLRGAELRHLVLWADADQDGRSDPGEVLPLARWSIEGLATTSEPHPSGIRFSPRGVELADGTRRPSYDLVLESLPAGAAAQPSPPRSR